MAINHILPLKAASLGAIANIINVFGSRDTSDVILTVSFTFTMQQCHLIQLASTPFTSFLLAKFG